MAEPQIILFTSPGNLGSLVTYIYKWLHHLHLQSYAKIAGMNIAFDTNKCLSSAKHFSIMVF